MPPFTLIPLDIDKIVSSRVDAAQHRLFRRMRNDTSPYGYCLILACGETSLETFMKKHKLTLTQIKALILTELILRQRKAFTISRADLQSVLGVTLWHTTRVISQLVAKGFLSRPRSGRVIITTAGMHFLKNLNASVIWHLQDITNKAQQR